MLALMSWKLLMLLPMPLLLLLLLLLLPLLLLPGVYNVGVFMCQSECYNVRSPQFVYLHVSIPCYNA